MSSTMNIAIAVNKAYLKYASVMLTSLCTQQSENLNVYVLHHDLSPEDQSVLSSLPDKYQITIEYIFVPDHLLPPKEVLRANSWGIETYFRLLLVDLLPAALDRALYIDVDMIINKSLTDFYYCDLGDKKLAACRDFTGTPPYNDYRQELFADILAVSPDFLYFNAGITLFHLNALRPAYNFAYYMDIAKQLDYKIQFPDQDLLNYCHWNETLFFNENKYNLYARRAYTDLGLTLQNVKDTVHVIHYATSKPWNGNCLHCDIEQLWWDYAKLTPFYNEFLEQMVYETVNSTEVLQYVTALQQENEQLYQIISQYDALLQKKGIHI